MANVYATVANVTPDELELAGVAMEDGSFKWHMRLGDDQSLFTTTDTLESFAALGRKILDLVEKERSMTDPDQATTPTIPVPSEPATDVPEPAPQETGDPVAAVMQSDRAH